MFDDADFAPLVADQTARFPLTELRIPRGNPDHVWLVLKHAGESNPAYMAAVKNAKFRGLSDDAANALGDQLAARHVIVGWENVLDKAGKPLTYSVAGCVELLAKLREAKRGGLISRLTLFAANAENFTAPTVDAGDLGNE